VLNSPFHSPTIAVGPRTHHGDGRAGGGDTRAHEVQRQRQQRKQQYAVRLLFVCVSLFVLHGCRLASFYLTEVVRSIFGFHPFLRFVEVVLILSPLFLCSINSQAQTIGDLSISQALGLARDQFLKTLSASTSGRAGTGNEGY